MAPVSGSFDIDYTVKNRKNEFVLASTSIDWVVVPDSTHASIVGRATLTTYVDGVMSVTQNMPVRIDIVLGTNGNADVTIRVYDVNANPATSQPLYVISEPIIVNGSNLQIN
jgi:hypothetical protein